MIERPCTCTIADHDPRLCTAGPAEAFAAGRPGVAHILACDLNRQDERDREEEVAIGIYRRARGRR